MAVVLRAPWGMSLKLEFDPLFMVTWDNQAHETWKLISFPKYDMPLTLSVWLPSSSPGYFKIPLDVTLSSRMQAADPVCEMRDSELPLGALAQLKHLLVSFPSKRNPTTVFQQKTREGLCFLRKKKSNLLIVINVSLGSIFNLLVQAFQVLWLFKAVVYGRIWDHREPWKELFPYKMIHLVTIHLLLFLCLVTGF